MAMSDNNDINRVICCDGLLDALFVAKSLPLLWIKGRIWQLLIEIGNKISYDKSIRSTLRLIDGLFLRKIR